MSLKEFIGMKTDVDNREVFVTIFADKWTTYLNDSTMETVGDAKVTNFGIYMEDGELHMNVWVDANLKMA